MNMNEHPYEPVVLSLWDVLKPHSESKKLKNVVLLHVFGTHGSSAIIVNSDDEVYATGKKNLQPCLGLSCDIGPHALVELTGFSHQNIKCFSSGLDFTIALTTDGRVLSCGANHHGQLGIGNQETRIGVCSVMIPKEETVVSIQCSSFYSLALTSSNKVYEWGRSGSMTAIGVLSTPKLMSFDPPSTLICQISCSVKISHYMEFQGIYAALAQNGDMYKWQNNDAKVIVANEVLAMSCSSYSYYGFFYIRNGNLYQNNEFIAEADDFVVKDDYLCFKKRQDFFLKIENELPKKVDVHNFLTAFANRETPQFVRMNHNAKALNTKKKIIRDNNFYEMFYNNKDLSDLTIKLSNGHIYLQKIILMGLCDHFKQVLTGPWAASSSSEMDMTCHNAGAYETFLKYIYSGIFYCDTLTGSDLIDLYNIADSYFENDLKDNVLEAFKRSLTIENVCQLYSLACNQMELANECLKLARNNLLAICATDGFNQMEGECIKTFMVNCATRNLLNK